MHPTSQKRSDTLPIIGGYIDLEDIFYQVIFTVDSSKLHKKSAKGIVILALLLFVTVFEFGIFTSIDLILLPTEISITKLLDKVSCASFFP